MKISALTQYWANNAHLGVSAHIEKDVFWRNYKWYKAQTFRKCYICDYLKLVKVQSHFYFGGGVIQAVKRNLPPTPPNYVQNHHFQKCENMKFIFNSQNAFIYH